MATYSTNLGLVLMTPGENPGTWGDTTNTNLGTLLEESISGYATQAMSDAGDTTITIPNGGTGVARNMCLVLTGTLSATRNLIVPAKKKLYFVFNNTTGGQSIVIKTAAGTGVTVPSVRRMVVACDGTNVVQALNYITGDISGNAGTVTNGLYSDISYSNPAWLTSLDGAKITGNIAGNAGTVTNGVYTTGTYNDPAWITGLSPNKMTVSVPLTKGGTGGNDAASARTNLGVPSLTGTGVSGTWGINVTGTANNVTGIVNIANGGTGSSTGGAFLRYSSGSSAVVTFGTGAATGGSDGDVHFQYA